MNQKTFSVVAGLIFLVVALAHALRLVFGWHVMLQGWTVPVWVSWIALFISGFLGYEGLRLSRRPS
jgi:CHASE2 domain-containing sensor protein